MENKPTFFECVKNITTKGINENYLHINGTGQLKVVLAFYYSN